MSFNTAALYGCHQPSPSSYQTRDKPLPPLPRASTMTQDAITQWHRDEQRMPGLRATDDNSPPLIFNRECSFIWDDANVQSDRAMAAIEQGMSIVLFARNVLVSSDGEIQSLLIESVQCMNANEGVAHRLTESKQRMTLSIANEGVVCLLTNRKNTLHSLITNECAMQLLTASDNGVNPLIANEYVVQLSIGGTTASATCRLDVMANTDLVLGRCPVHQFVLCPPSLLPHVLNPVLEDLNLNL